MWNNSSRRDGCNGRRRNHKTGQVNAYTRHLRSKNSFENALEASETWLRQVTNLREANEVVDLARGLGR